MGAWGVWEQHHSCMPQVRTRLKNTNVTVWMCAYSPKCSTTTVRWHNNAVFMSATDVRLDHHFEATPAQIFAHFCNKINTLICGRPALGMPLHIHKMDTLFGRWLSCHAMPVRLGWMDGGDITSRISVVSALFRRVQLSASLTSQASASGQCCALIVGRSVTTKRSLHCHLLRS